MKTAIALCLGTFMLATLTGCPCPKPEPKGELLPAISTAGQIQKINARSQQITTLRARGRVTVTYLDKDGKQHQDSADGSLLLRRMTWKLSDKDPTDIYYKVVLFGRVANQDVFELGENDKTFWMATRVEPKTAHVANKPFPIITDSHDPAAEAMPIRAGMIPLLLGLAPTAPGDIVVTHTETVSLLSLRQERNAAFPYAEVEFSRYAPGDPIAVRIYHPDGSIEGEAELSEYTTLPGGPIRLPHKIVVTYPSRKAKIELTIDKPTPLTEEGYQINPEIKDAAFIMPAFEKQGLKVNPDQGR